MSHLRHIKVLVVGPIISFNFGSAVAYAVEDESERDPGRAAEEDYANRAYPAAEIPFGLTLNAQNAFNQIKSKGVGKGKNFPGQWSLIGPRKADYPSILTDSGADYVASGRTTALAIAPGCSTKSCRL